MTSYGFSFRATTRKDRKVGRLYLRVVHGGESRSVTTEYAIYPEEWDPVGRRLSLPLGRSDRGRQLMEYQNSMHCDMQRLENIIKELARQGAYSIDEIMDRYRSVMYGNTLGSYAEQLAVGLEREGFPRTARAYRSSTKRFIKFMDKRDVKLEHITAALVNDFQHRLKMDGMSMNTISFYMRTLRAIHNKAIAEGRIPKTFESPFAGVYTGLQTTRKLALTGEELAKLVTHDPTLPKELRSPESYDMDRSVQEALAMFLFCYHARGLCFVDLCGLKKKDIRNGTLRYRRRKTGQIIELAVQPAMRRIIEWFAMRVRNIDYLFPIIMDHSKNLDLQYNSGLRIQNQRLKRLAKQLGIEKQISTHSARHSWATVAKNEGLPLAVISEGLGHNNQKTTEIYLASMNKDVLDQATRRVSEAIKPAAYNGRNGVNGVNGVNGGKSANGNVSNGAPRGRATYTKNIRIMNSTAAGLGS